MVHLGLQCKHIPDRPIVAFVASRSPEWCNWFPGNANSVLAAMPPGVPAKLALAKMAMLVRRGLLKGCCCGCRGDFEITPKGMAFLADDDEEDA